MLLAPPARADGPVELRIGWVQVGHVTPMYDILVKRHPEIFPHYGKSYKFAGVRFNGTTPEIQALAVDELEIASMAPSALHARRHQREARHAHRLGPASRTASRAGTTSPMSCARTARSRPIEDIKGKRVATNAIGSASDTAMRIMLRKHNIQDSDFTTIETNFANMFPMIEDGKVDLIAVLPQDVKRVARQRPLPHALHRGEARGPAETVAWAMRADFIAAHRAALVDFFEDHLRALRWFLDPKHHDEAVAIAAQVTKQKPDELGYFFTQDDFYRAPDCMPDIAAGQKEIDDLVRLGILKDGITLAPTMSIFRSSRRRRSVTPEMIGSDDKDGSMTAEVDRDRLEQAPERSAAAAAFMRYLPLLILAAVWEGAARSGLVSQLALPTLSSVLESWVGLLQPSDPAPALTMTASGIVAWLGWLFSGDLVTNGLDSLWRLGAGLGMAIVIGTLLGVLMAWYRAFDAIMNPIVQVFYPMPKSALIPVTVLWLGFGHWSKIVLIFIGCMLPVTLSAYNGARGTEQALVWSARSLGASRRRTLFEVVLPSALPELL